MPAFLAAGWRGLLGAPRSLPLPARLRALLLAAPSGRRSRGDAAPPRPAGRCAADPQARRAAGARPAAALTIWGDLLHCATLLRAESCHDCVRTAIPPGNTRCGEEGTQVPSAVPCPPSPPRAGREPRPLGLRGSGLTTISFLELVEVVDASCHYLTYNRK